jgi:sulfur-oxidizing protein SoxY
MPALTRRDALALGVGAAAAWTGPGRAGATPSEAEAEIAKFTGGKAAAPGRIAIDLPEIAENGNAVQLSVTVESPMTAADHVTTCWWWPTATPIPASPRSTSRRCPAARKPRPAFAWPRPRT